MTMSNETRHPDIEIYIKNRSLDQILDWLRTRCDALKPQNSTGNTYALMATMNGARVPSAGSQGWRKPRYQPMTSRSILLRLPRGRMSMRPSAILPLQYLTG